MTDAMTSTATTEAVGGDEVSPRMALAALRFIIDTCEIARQGPIPYGLGDAFRAVMAIAVDAFEHHEKWTSLPRPSPEAN